MRQHAANFEMHIEPNRFLRWGAYVEPSGVLGALVEPGGGPLNWGMAIEPHG